MTKCPVCGEWHDSMKGVYICPKCGSKDMVQAANDNKLLIDVLNSVRDGKEPEIIALLKRVLAMMLNEMDEQEKAQLFLDVESYVRR